MSAKITITKINFTAAPSANQTVTVFYRPCATASVPNPLWTLKSDAVTVGVDGTLAAPLEITGLNEGACYELKAVNNCDATKNVTLSLTTAKAVCPKVTGVVAVASGSANP